MPKSYSDKLKDPRWQKKRLEILQRDEWKCRVCGGKDKSLHIHHCIYSKEPWDAPNWSLISLCEECHSMRQECENEVKRMLSSANYGQLCSIRDLILSLHDAEFPLPLLDHLIVVSKFIINAVHTAYCNGETNGSNQTANSRES